VNPVPEAPAVDAALALAVPEIDATLRRRLALVENRLREAVASRDPLADSTSRHLVEAGGKRVRPLLTLLASHLGDPERAEVLDAAVVVELTHLASLYHDDVMDSAPVRRGAPSAHEVWGNSVAILTGDLLFARASRIVAGLGPEAVRIQARTFERLCLGQLHETVGPADGEDAVSHYVQVLADKTGSLIATAARFGAMFGGCSQEIQDVLVQYGEKVGVAFQLADDVIDLTSDRGTSGKTPGTDLREGVVTLPVLLARRQAAEQGDRASLAVLEALDVDLSADEDLARAVALLREHPATAATRRQARDWAEDAVAVLAPLPSGVAKDALGAFAEAVVARAS